MHMHEQLRFGAFKRKSLVDDQRFPVGYSVLRVPLHLTQCASPYDGPATSTGPHHLTMVQDLGTVANAMQ